ncbi:hypothetical protein Tsubulata_034998 [Turnera subulata]|uniref:Endonuclease/exonuclease/phosphatase domain-containing protein n=1 Tax=Turnera subulata TaxID=218843 RepID=A0A9Q0FUK5_9ROSI|nr:hypothetical protein Tsubulata_034998 [Turnera subulata]
MSCISWNYRGLGRPRVVRAVRDLVRHENPDILFLAETRQGNRMMERLKWRMGLGNGVFVDPIGSRGGLALLWKDGVEVRLQSFSRFHIDALVEEEGVPAWRITGFYGAPVATKRRVGWNVLQILAGRSNLSWLCFGNFNEILWRSEQHGRRDRSEWQMRDFRRIIDVYAFRDLGYRGRDFTWANNREGTAFVEGRLDRAFATASWTALFPPAMVDHLEHHVSDHCPVRVLLEGDNDAQRLQRRRRVFRFGEIWARDEESEDVVTQSWGELRGECKIWCNPTEDKRVKG